MKFRRTRDVVGSKVLAQEHVSDWDAADLRVRRRLPAAIPLLMTTLFYIAVDGYDHHRGWNVDGEYVRKYSGTSRSPTVKSSTWRKLTPKQQELAIVQWHALKEAEKSSTARSSSSWVA